MHMAIKHDEIGPFYMETTSLLLWVYFLILLDSDQGTVWKSGLSRGEHLLLCYIITMN